MIDNSGKSRVLVVEIKPASQTKAPVRGKRKLTSFARDLATYEVNQSKWIAARSLCQSKGVEFHIWTENTLKLLGLFVK
jgi:hypothetical protein